MAQPKWNTDAGDLGTYTTLNNIDILLSAYPEYPATEVHYLLLNGELPPPMVLTIGGRVIGKPDVVNNDKTYTFTVRAVDNFGKIRDRTFSMTIQGAAAPKFTTISGNILTVLDGQWVEYQLEYTDPIDPTSVHITMSGGKLPPGLEITKTGLIRGYCQPPTSTYGEPTTTSYQFSLKLTNDLGTAQSSFSITVQNYNIAHSPKSRPPVILNKRPLSLVVPADNQYYVYYLANEKIPLAKDNDYFAFKVIGHDFDNAELQYEYYELPPGLSGDINTGWITGRPTLGSDSIHAYEFRVRAKKKSPTISVIGQKSYWVDIQYIPGYRYPWQIRPNTQTSATVFVLPVKPPTIDSLSVTIAGEKVPRTYVNNLGQTVANYTVDLARLTLTFATAVTDETEVNITIFGTVPDIYSKFETFTFTITKNIVMDVTWKTDTDLGTIYNNTVSDLAVAATSKFSLEYRLIDGSLPPNLVLYNTGEIGGKVPNQPTSKFLNVGEKTTFTFTVEAFSPVHQLLSSTRTFTLVVEQFYGTPTESMYFKATPNFADRAILNSLLTDKTLIPDELLYRPEDQYFGKAKDVRFVQVYGMNAGTIEKYVSAIDLNHYWRTVNLGPLKTAVAKDDLGNIVYEVVYSEIVDDLSNNKGEGPPKDIYWKKPIDLNLGPWIDSEGEVFTTYDNNGEYYTSLDPGYTSHVYPASFANMRTQIASVLAENYDGKLLPRWMRSQQTNGSILGYVQAWVICYTKPGKSATVLNNITTNWKHNLNEIYFEIDRYVVDKSSTFDYNSYLTQPTWENLPSASPAPSPLDTHDFYVLFPRKTILPR